IFYFIHLMLPAAIYSAAVALPIFGLVAFINSKIAKTERRRTNLRYYSNVYNTYGEKRRRY
ncbi:MAG: hypothetical protein IJC39_05795, partial [Firmicutes bacterium]|nr:hypothetical protein [Bacillota bacterium]